MDENAQIKKCFHNYLINIYGITPQEIQSFCEDELTLFIRNYITSKITIIYQNTDCNFYLNIRRKIAIDKAIQAVDKESGGMYSCALKYYIGFLQSKYFPRSDLPFEGKAKKKKDKHQVIFQELELPEGSKKHIEQERCWRNPKLRQACIAHYGYVCQCCGFDFSKAYGEDLGKAFIEVHHLKPISSFDDEHLVNPIKDLVPLCSNCHAMIHRGKEGPLTLRELREKYKGIKWEIPVKMED